jgi:hypothetical protein
MTEARTMGVAITMAAMTTSTVVMEYQGTGVRLAG